jgi:hypothetical protein
MPGQTSKLASSQSLVQHAHIACISDRTSLILAIDFLDLQGSARKSQRERLTLSSAKPRPMLRVRENW